MMEPLIVGTVPYDSWGTVRKLEPRREFQERLAKGCFWYSLFRRHEVKLQVCHDRPTWPYATTADGSLDVTEDDRGIHFTFYGDLEQIPHAALYRAACAREFEGVSPSFIVESDEWDGDRRTIVMARLKEISLTVRNPVYTAATYQALPL